MNKNIKVGLFYIAAVIIAILIANSIQYSSKSSTVERYSLNKMVDDIKGDLVSKVEVRGSSESTVSGKAWIYFKDEKLPKQELEIIGLDSFMKELYEYNKTYDFKIITLELQRPRYFSTSYYASYIYRFCCCSFVFCVTTNARWRWWW